MTTFRFLDGRFAATACGLMATTLAAASPLEVRKNDVIPVRFDSRLSTADSRRGDTFTATPERDDVFPRGATVEGHVVRVTAKTKRRAASMDLAFDDVRMPDGSRYDIVGVPIPLSSKFVDRDRDGHYVAKPAIRKDTAVGIGALAGLIIGTILHKPFEGTFVGTLAGILVASSAGADDSLVINQGAEAGVLFQRTVRFDSLSARSTSEPQDSPVDDSASLDVKIGDHTLRYTSDIAPFQVGSTLMVPIQATAKQLGLSYDETGSSIFTESDTHSLRFEQNSSDYRIDGRSATLAAAVVRRNGVWYAPARAFDPALGL
ncbi:MAG: stalk domain-containing protein [Fimbriimonadaceae bacterium]